jgi:hypothetical protein
MDKLAQIDSPVEMKARIAELERALAFYASKAAWVYRIDKCHLEVHAGNGKLVIPAYPETRFPVLEDHGEIARAALGQKKPVDD